MKKNLTRFLLCALLLLALVIPFVATPAAADGDTPTPAATFEFGANGTAGHKDGSSDQATYSETSNGYTLSITGGSKMYPSSYDANGNSCIKFGSSSAAGKFTFTVPADVIKVVINIAGYKDANAKVTVNGVSHTITTKSNNGDYTSIEVDTSTTKTVSFTTVSGGYRAMVNSIEFYTASTSGGESGGDTQTYTAEFSVPADFEAVESIDATSFEAPNLTVPAKYSKYTFVGWAIESVADGTETSPTLVKPGYTVELTNDVKYYAVFSYAKGEAVTDWTLATDTSALNVGDKVVIASTKGFVAGAISNQYLTSIAVTIENNIISALPDGAVVYTLGKSFEDWTFATADGQLLGATAKGKLALDRGITSWSISISNGDATIQNGTESYGRFLYNVNSPRFTTYTSSTSSSMLLPQLFVQPATEINYTSAPVAGCTHTNTTTTTVDATCTEKGSVTVTCNDCGETVSHESIDALGHTFDEGEVTVEPGKGTEGTLTKTCEVCGVEVTESIPALGFIVTYVVPDGVTQPESSQGLEVTLPNGVEVPSESDLRPYVFAGWAKATIDGEITDDTGIYKPDEKVALTDDTTFYAVYSYTYGSNDFELKDIADILSTDIVVITVKTNDGTVYALSSANGASSAPTAVKVTVAGDKLTDEPADALKWNIGSSSTGYIIYVNGSTETWLYCTNANNGVRVGNNAANTFVIDSSSGYLKHSGTSRYVGVYTTNPDFRCYDSPTATNIKDQTLAFYAKSGNSATYYTTNPQKAVCDHADTRTETVDATCTAEGTKTTICNKCGLTIGEETIPALDHSYSEGVVTTAPTCTTEGVMTFTCAACGNEKTETIPVSDHTYVDGTCSVCGKIDYASIDFSGDYYIGAIKNDVKYYLNNTLASKKFGITAANVEEWPTEIADADKSLTFTLKKNEDGTYCIYIKNAGKYVGGGSSTDISLDDIDSAARIEVTKNDDGSFRFLNVNSESRYFGVNGSNTSEYVGWYKDTNIVDLVLITVPVDDFSGAALVIGEDLSIRFNLDLVHTENINGYTVKFILGGVEHTADILSPAGAYYADCTRISPEKMGDTVIAQLLYNGEAVAEIEYSVLTYVQYQLAKEGISAELKTLLIDLLNYGAAAQQYKGYKTDSLVIDVLSNANKEQVSTDTPTDEDNDRSRVENDTDKLDVTSAGVRFAYNNRVFVRFTAPILASVADEDLADTLTVTVSHGGAEAYQVNIYNNGGGNYVVYSEGILAHEFGKTITFTFTCGETELATVTYSVNSYAFAMQDDTEIGNLALALYNYGKSAEAYAESEDTNS